MPNYIQTWKGIAVALERSERWCRYMARRSPDPLPVFKLGGTVCLGHDDLEQWLLRQRAQAIQPSLPSLSAGPRSIDAAPPSLGGTAVHPDAAGGHEAIRHCH